ncbi:MAG: tetratricopeptide repeat protein [Pseudomonadales bacterium]|nr:tetratricopeptide repeat protein [Pseudomonadales bacterium]
MTKLGDLVPIYLAPNNDITKVGTEELLDAYNGLLASVEDEDVLAESAFRKADLELALQDQLAEKAEADGDDSFVPNYDAAINSYELALQQYPDQTDNDQSLYLLAKAYDLSMNPEMTLQTLTRLVEQYPDSKYMVEAQFRRGDFLFVNDDYALAQDAFSYVVNNGVGTAFYENALYMQGWSQFKRNDYDAAVRSFAAVLDRSMPADGKLDGVPDTKRSLVDDSLRVMAITFTYLDGYRTIDQLFVELEGRTYKSLLYEQLADLYISQQRYRDAIDTFEAYIALNPLEREAPYIQSRILDTMVQAKFYREAFAKKEEFVDTYNQNSDYYRFNDEEAREYVTSFLYVYIDEVARFYHAKAQKSNAQSAARSSAKRAEMQADYRKAIEYYELFITSFTDDWHTPEKVFYVAEAYAELGDLPKAVTNYERSAYDYGIHPFSEEAAYASILGYKQLLENAEQARQDEAIDIAKQRKLAAQIAFAKTYNFSQYARPVLLDSIDMMYNEQEYAMVIDQGRRFLDIKPAPDTQEKVAIWTLIAHSEFETKNYAEAESSYLQVLSLMSANDKRRSNLIDRVAASVYRQGEIFANQAMQFEEEMLQYEKMGDQASVDAKQEQAIELKLQAVDEFLRVAVISPSSKFRKTAEYDAGAYLLQAEQWPRALQVLSDYRKRYDPKRKDLDITGKIIAAYEGLDNYQSAADELQFVLRNEKDPEKLRVAQYLAAEYYEKAGNEKRALESYRAYANKYPKPFDLAMETRYRLSEMYLKQGDESKRRFWLDKIIVEEKKAGANSTARAKYLAAFSRNVFAKTYYDDFAKIRLTAPLYKSLDKKQKAMELALKKYEQVMAYQVQEFTTQSTYYVASIYAKLSADLLASERPKGLDELALEEYGYLLEDQAFPFEETAIETHQANIENSWNGFYDQWVDKSIKALSELMPGNYDKVENAGELSRVIY